MAYYLVEKVRAKHPASSNLVLVPAVYGQTKYWSISLGTHALVKTIDEVSDTRAIKIADGPTEKLATASKNQFTDYFGREIPDGLLHEVVANLLINPVNQKFKPFQSDNHGYLTLRFGSEIFYRKQISFPRRSTQTFIDNWSGNGNLNGRILSGNPGVEWVEVDGTQWTTSGNQCLVTNASNGPRLNAILDTNTDTDDSYTSVEWASSSRDGTSYLDVGILVRSSSNISSSYCFFYYRYGGGGSTERGILLGILINGELDEVLDDSEGQLYTAGSVYLEANGSAIEANLESDGLNASNSDISGVGNRRTGLTVRADGSSSNDAAYGPNYQAGDLAVPPSASSGFGQLLALDRNYRVR